MGTPLHTSVWRLVGAVMLLAGPFSLANAAGLKILSEEDLSKEVGRDGISFATSLNMAIGSYVFTPYPYTVGSIRLDDLRVTGTVLTTFDLLPGANGSPDIAQWYFPMISTTKPLQMEYDFVVSKDKDLGTSVMYKDFIPNGSAFQWAVGPNATTEGFDLGFATNLSIGHLILNPNGRKSPLVDYGQMKLEGINIGGTTSGSPWFVADIKTQPAKLRFPNEPGVTMQLGIDWPVGTAEAATGKLSIDKVAFTTVPTSDTPSKVVDLGSSSIGSMQIQYLNIKFK